MDPLSHVLFGRAVALTLPAPKAARGVTAALVLGSILPDIDAPLVFRGFDVYLRAHEAGTHSLCGSAVEALTLGLLLSWLIRGSRLWPLIAASWIGVIGHIAWDLADGSDIRLFAPFSAATSGWHLVVMAEPCVLSLLIVLTVYAWHTPLYRRRAAIVALASLTLFIGAKKASQLRAIERYSAQLGDGGFDAIAPHGNELLGWTIYARRGREVRAWNLSAANRPVSLSFKYVDAEDPVIVTESRRLPVVARFLKLAKVPFVRILREDARTLVLWSDLTGCNAVTCAASFGGTFDRSRTPIEQIILIGPVSQRLPLPAHL